MTAADVILVLAKPVRIFPNVRQYGIMIRNSSMRLAGESYL